MQDLLNRNYLKVHNMKQIYHLLRQKGQMTKSELAREAHLSFVSVSKICTKLEKSGLVDVSVKSTRTEGRKAAAITFKSHALWTIAIDIKRTDHMDIALLDLNNNIKERHGFPIKKTMSLEDILEIMKKGIASLNQGGTLEIMGVSIGISAVYNPSSGIILQSANPVFERVNLVRYLEEAIPEYPFLIENDANLASLSQARLNSKSKNQLFLFFTQGIGLGIIIKGEIYRGTHGFAGELGHIKVSHGTKTCRLCGGLGCLRTVATLRSIAEDLNEWETLENTEKELYAEDLRIRYSKGETQVVDRLNFAAEKIGEVLSVLFGLFNPEEIVLGGNMTPVLSHLIGTVRNNCRKLSNLAGEVDLQIRVVGDSPKDLVLKGGGERVFRHWMDHLFHQITN